jgi:chemosensory pili system protein ChpA (sensor histidine kinase/response regulator)
MTHNFIEELEKSYSKQKQLSKKISSLFNVFSQDKNLIQENQKISLPSSLNDDAKTMDFQIFPQPTLESENPIHSEGYVDHDEKLIEISTSSSLTDDEFSSLKNESDTSDLTKDTIMEDPNKEDHTFVNDLENDAIVISQVPVEKEVHTALETNKLNEFIGNPRHFSYDTISDDMVEGSIDDLTATQEKIDSIILDNFEESRISELKRQLHTLKGVLGFIGAKRGFELVHAMESALDNSISENQPFLKEAWLHVYQIIESLKKGQTIVLLTPLKYASKWLNPEWVDSEKDALIQSTKSQQKTSETIVLDTPKKEVPFTKEVSSQIKLVPELTPEPKRHLIEDSRISLSANTLEIWSEQVRVARQAQDATGVNIHSIINKLDDMDDGIRKMGSMLRELEWHADSHLQAKARRYDKDSFDPLEMDRFTRLQELTRQVSEGSDDIQEIRQDIIRNLALMEEWKAKEGLALSELDKGMTETRLQPMESMRRRLTRVIKVALEYANNKKVDFELIDNGVELDRNLLEKILRPLEHTLRNSVAHGIESVEQRIRDGKNPSGKIRLECTQQAGHLVWVLSDDGQGINVERVKNKAVELGIISKDEKISMKDAIELICKPSFSTSTEVNEISGRGVGMDVVRNDVVSIGGRFIMESVFGKGTTTTITVPSSSYAIQSLVVKAGANSYAIPNEIVSDFWLIQQSEFQDIQKNNTIIKNGTTYNYKTIFDILSIEGTVSSKARNLYAVLVKDRDESLVVIVDRMVGLFELTMLPLGDFWTTAPWIVGSVLLQDGIATFLINPLVMNSLRYDMTIQTSKEIEQTVQKAKKETTILVVDDSLTVRKSTSRILKLSGYNVLTAKDGKEGFEMFSLNEPDLVITDVEMPRMDGFELLRSIRQGVSMPDIPVIIITSRTAQRHRSHAESLKASAYLGKPYKDDELLECIKGLLK